MSKRSYESDDDLIIEATDDEKEVKPSKGKKTKTTKRTVKKKTNKDILAQKAKRDIKENAKTFLQKLPEKSKTSYKKTLESRKNTYVVMGAGKSAMAEFPTKTLAARFMVKKVNTYGTMQIARKHKGKNKETIGAKKKIVVDRKPSEYQKFIKEMWNDPAFKSKYTNEDGKILLKGAANEISKEWRKTDEAKAIAEKKSASKKKTTTKKKRVVKKK